jgi:hypothetical protein
MEERALPITFTVMGSISLCVAAGEGSPSSHRSIAMAGSLAVPAIAGQACCKSAASVTAAWFLHSNHLLERRDLARHARGASLGTRLAEVIGAETLIERAVLPHVVHGGQESEAATPQIAASASWR